MPGYDLDHKKSLFGSVLSRMDLSKLAAKACKVKLKHHDYDDFLEASIKSIEDDKISITVDEVADSQSFYIHDHLVLSFVKSNKVFWANGEILAVGQDIPVELTLKLNDIKKRENLRKQNRYFVSLTGSMKHDAEDNECTIIVKDISFLGLRVNCTEDLEFSSIVYITVNISKLRKFSFKGRIVRKVKNDKNFEYGIEICNILRENNIMLYDYINTLENNIWTR